MPGFAVADHQKVQADRRADGLAQLVQGQAFGGGAEVAREVLDVRAAEIAGDEAGNRLGLLFQVLAVGRRRAEIGQGLLRGRDLVGSGVRRQTDGSLFQIDDGRAAAGVLLAQLQDIDAVIDLDRLGDLARTHLLDGRQQLRLKLRRRNPSHVAPRRRGGGRGELPRDGTEGRPLLDLLDQLLGAAHRLRHAARAGGFDEDLADQELWLVGGRLQALQHGGDLARAYPDPGAVAALDHPLPADLHLELVAKRLDVEPDAGELTPEFSQGGVVLLGQLGESFVDLIVLGDDLELLFLLELAHLLHLDVLVHQGAQRLVLHLRHVLLRGRDAGGDDQQKHALAQVVGRDDVVVDQGGHAAADLRDRPGLGRRRRDRGLQQLIGRRRLQGLRRSGAPRAKA